MQKSKTKVAGVPLDEYIRIIEAPRAIIGIEGIDERIKCIPTPHEEEMPSCALYFNGVLYSGDTNASQLILPEASKAKIIIHEARLSDIGSHMNIEKLAKNASPEILAKTWCIHYSTKMKEDIIVRAKELGFAGACVQGQTIDF